MSRWLLLAVATLLLGGNLWITHEIHEDHRRELARCQHQLIYEVQWKPGARDMLLPADPCDALRTVRRGR